MTLGVLAVSASWLHYLWLIPRERVPKRPTLHGLLMVLGILAGGLALITPDHRGVALAVGAVYTWPLGGFFLWLLTQARLPDPAIRVEAGGPLPDFSTVDADGKPFSTEDLAGRRVLLKLFRGHW